ncbi:hypothetical protein KIW84_074883 [Lathyrus oleraceus]|uniref:Uncharacterized protein n=1 Tax=Pisum sativum TaxID=3888 RepID=A0A9D4VSL4_PEA|nr:hypothetical protein KIW84_074883 [Pisum sativum]
MTTDFLNQVVIDEQVEDRLKKDNKQKVAASILPLLPQEQRLLPHHRPAQSNHKLKQKQISKGNKDQEGRRAHNDPIPMSYTQSLPILVNAGAIMPKEIESAKFPYHHKHDPHTTCGYHAGYVGHYTEACHVLKTKVQELINRNLLCFTPITTKVLIEKEFKYKGPPIHVQIHPPVVQPIMQYPNQGYHLGMLLAYHGASSFIIVVPQYAYTEESYVPFGIHHGHTSHLIVSPGLVHYAQMFQPMAIPHLRSLQESVNLGQPRRDSTNLSELAGYGQSYSKAQEHEKSTIPKNG